jgi:multidrug resistance efflux pump
MKNVSKLRSELSKVFEQLKNSELDIQQAKAIVATSNAMLKSAQLELEHSKMTGQGKAIEFLTTE